MIVFVEFWKNDKYIGIQGIVLGALAFLAYIVAGNYFSEYQARFFLILLIAQVFFCLYSKPHLSKFKFWMLCFIFCIFNTLTLYFTNMYQTSNFRIFLPFLIVEGLIFQYGMKLFGLQGWIWRVP